MGRAAAAARRVPRRKETTMGSSPGERERLLTANKWIDKRESLAGIGANARNLELAAP